MREGSAPLNRGSAAAPCGKALPFRANFFLLLLEAEPPAGIFLLAWRKARGFPLCAVAEPRFFARCQKHQRGEGRKHYNHVCSGLYDSSSLIEWTSNSSSTAVENMRVNHRADTEMPEASDVGDLIEQLFLDHN